MYSDQKSWQTDKETLTTQYSYTEHTLTQAMMVQKWENLFGLWSCERMHWGLQETETMKAISGFLKNRGG